MALNQSKCVHNQLYIMSCDKKKMAFSQSERVQNQLYNKL